eukprot:gene2484-2722_t
MLGERKGPSYQPLPSKDVEMNDLLNKVEEGKALLKNNSSSKSLTSSSASSPPTIGAESSPSTLSLYELFQVLSPYFWPSGEGSDNVWVNRARSSSTWLMVILSKLCSLTAPLFLSQATNALIQQQLSTATWNICFYSGLRLGASVCKEAQSMLYIKVKQQASIQLQVQVFTHLHNLSLQWHLSKKTGSVMKSMDRGVEAANQLITYLFLYLIPALAECLAVVILFFVSYGQYGLGVIVFTGVAAYCGVTIWITQYRKRYREETNKHDNAFHDQANDSILNYETVKYFTNESYEINKYKSSVFQYQKANTSTQYSLSALNISQQVILGGTLFACMVVAGRSVIHGSMSIGAWIAVQAWVNTVFQPLNFLGSIYSAVFQAFIDIRNLSELLSQSPDIVDDLDAQQLALPSASTVVMGGIPRSINPAGQGISVEFRNVSFSYPGQGEGRGLKNVSFLVPPGSTTAIVGPTGAGKTTISRLLFRFFDPVKGSVLIHGQDIRHLTQASVRKAIGIVPQDTVLFNSTIKHNVGYGRLEASFQEIEAAADAAQIRSFIETGLPQGWETIVENSIQEALQTLGKARTVLVIAHRLSTIRNADQIIVLSQGEVVEVGKHEELLERPDGVYRKLWEMQLGKG